MKEKQPVFADCGQSIACNHNRIGKLIDSFSLSGVLVYSFTGSKRFELGERTALLSLGISRLLGIRHRWRRRRC